VGLHDPSVELEELSMKLSSPCLTVNEAQTLISNDSQVFHRARSLGSAMCAHGESDTISGFQVAGMIMETMRS